MQFKARTWWTSEFVSINTMNHNQHMPVQYICECQPDSLRPVHTIRKRRLQSSPKQVVFQTSLPNIGDLDFASRGKDAAEASWICPRGCIADRCMYMNGRWFKRFLYNPFSFKPIKRQSLHVAFGATFRLCIQLSHTCRTAANLKKKVYQLPPCLNMLSHKVTCAVKYAPQQNLSDQWKLYRSCFF